MSGWLWMGWLWLAVFASAASYLLGHYIGYRRGTEAAVVKLDSFLRNVAWSGSVRDCIQLLQGNETIESLRATARGIRKNDGS